MQGVVKRYVKERDAMLKKCSVKEFRKFVNKHKSMYSKEYLLAFNSAADEVLEISLHKMIVNVVTLPEDLRKKSAMWLLNHGYNLEVN